MKPLEPNKLERVSQEIVNKYEAIAQAAYDNHALAVKIGKKDEIAKAKAHRELTSAIVVEMDKAMRQLNLIMSSPEDEVN